VKSNLPIEVNDGVKAVEVCKANGKLATDSVPANARETRLFYIVPPEAVAWATQNGKPPVPTARCDDVYKGVKKAEITQPAAGTPPTTSKWARA
jgi:hypothetical protein